MDISISDPIQQAWDRTIDICFDPFDLKKWFVMGVGAFLAHLFTSFGNYQYSQQTSSYSAEDVEFGKLVEEWVVTGLGWIREHLVLFMSLFVIISVILTVLWVLVIWLRSRGKFIFLDNVVNDVGRVSNPWSEYRAEGNNLCLFLIIFWSIVFGLWLVCLLVSGGLSLSGYFGTLQYIWLWVGVIVFVISTGLFWLTSLLFNFCLENFVVPIMFIREMNALPAWAFFYEEILSDYFGEVLIYGLVKFALGICSFIVIFLFGCLTCCVGFLLVAFPYIGSVLTLPITVFLKSFNLYFLEQWGAGWQFFVER